MKYIQPEMEIVILEGVYTDMPVVSNDSGFDLGDMDQTTDDGDMQLQ